MLSRIRNAIAVRKNQVSLPHSKTKEAVAKLLQQSKFIEAVEVDGEGITKKLVLTINSPDQNARITEIVRLSTPGRRWYAPAKAIPVVKRGRGIIIVSTSKGMMTGDTAKKERLGGELICKVY
jgi:small subunit ribosomal protein S8